MTDDKSAMHPGATNSTKEDAQFLHTEFGVRPDKAAALSTDDPAEAEKAETAVRQENTGGGAVPGATSPEASTSEIASDVNEDYDKPLVKDDNDPAGPS